MTAETKGVKRETKLNDKERRLLGDMVNGGLLYIYVDDDGGIEGSARHADWPKPGTGAIGYDGPPTKITKRFVRLLWRCGTEWDERVKAEVLSQEGIVVARALLERRDVWLLSSPGRSALAAYERGQDNG